MKTEGKKVIKAGREGGREVNHNKKQQMMKKRKKKKIYIKMSNKVDRSVGSGARKSERREQFDLRLSEKEILLNDQSKKEIVIY